MYRWDLEVGGGRDLVWTRHRWTPIHVNRGVCGTCDTLVVEHIAASPWSIVVGPAWTDPSLLPKARGHAFYGSRVQDVDDQLPKRSGYLSSQLGITRWLLEGTVQRELPELG
jgi:hypothetical protein